MVSKKDDSGILTFEERRQLLVQHWLEFESAFAEGSDGSEELCEMILNAGLKKCSQCHGIDLVKIVRTRSVRCNNCFAKSSLTANTFFHNVRRPKAWLGAIRMMELGLDFSAHMLSVVAKVSYATAWEIMKKLDEVLVKKLDSQLLFLPSRSFESLYSKRSRETPAREHPKSEQRIAEKEHRKRNKVRVSVCNERERKILAAIGEKSTDAELLSEKLALSPAVLSAHLMMLELAGFIERSDGESYKRKLFANTAAKPNEHVRGLVKKFVRSLRVSKRGISRKYVHLYVARFWCMIDRDKWRDGTLLNECLNFKPGLDANASREKAPLLVPFPTLVA